MVVYVETKGNWSSFTSFDLYKDVLNMSAAEQFCAIQSKQLATVGSQLEQDELFKVVDDWPIWLGGRRKAEGGEWEWSYQNWRYDEPKNKIGDDCMVMRSE